MADTEVSHFAGIFFRRFLLINIVKFKCFEHFFEAQNPITSVFIEISIDNFILIVGKGIT